MNPLEGMSRYLARLERGLRWLAVSRGAALLGAAALVLTLVLAFALDRLAFPSAGVSWARALLFLGLAAALAVGLVMPLLRLNRRRSARAAEQKFPAFGDRLLTFAERQRANPTDPFLPLLAEDALAIAEQSKPSEVAVPARAAGFASLAATMCGVLVWLALSGPGFLGYGTALLWGGNPKAERKPFRAITVQPGDAVIRRRMDQTVFAKLQGFDAPGANVFARYASSAKFEQAPMQHQPNGAAFEFTFAALPEAVEYYVEAAGVRSSTYKLTVSDLPSVKKLRVTYHFPAYYGLPDAVEDPGGDLRAVEGTSAEVQVQTDKPLTDASLVLDSGEQFALAGVPLTARVPIRKDGMYHVSAMDHGHAVRLSEDFFIEARRDLPPVISIARPARDAGVSPIEEVPVKVEARDDFGLQGVELHYSVNGGPEKVQSLLSARGAKTASGAALLALEEFHLVPGDIVSLYATAKDARSTSQTDIVFIQAKPFEFNYSQSQQASSNSAGGDPSEKIAEREKEIIAATWNQLRAGKDNAAAENAKYLADVQAKVRDQANSLVERMKSRELGNNASTQAFVQNMEEAVRQMGPAAGELRKMRWQPALSPEQKALQYLLRAESIFRDIQISMSRNGGGGGQSGATRDMENLSELELDVNKNQYESGRQSAEDDQQKKIDEALQRLKELAHRQQELAAQQQRAQNFQQRWEQEMLRREAEQLRRQMEQLAQGGQQMPGAQPQPSGGSSPGASQGQQSRQRQSEPDIARNDRSGNRQTLEQAIERLNQATREMGDSASAAGRQPNSDDSRAGARRAAERLEEAGKMLSQMRRQQTGSAVDELARQAGQMVQREEAFSQKLREKFGGGAGAERSSQESQKLSEQLAGEKERLREDLERLERGMQQTARDMASTQPDAAAKMRDAISTLQQDEVQSRMKRSEQQIRQGLAPYAVMSEAMVVRSLHDVHDKLGEAQRLMDRSPQGDQGLERALEQAGKVRQSLERLSAGQRSASRAQRGGQQGSRGGGDTQQGGQEPGSESAGSPSVAPRESAGGLGGGGGAAIDRGTGGQYSPDAPLRPMTQQEYDALGRQIAQLQRAARDNPEVAPGVADLLRDFNAMDPRRLGDARLLEQLEARILARTEEVEMLLRRKVDEKQGATVRSAAPAPVPQGYGEAVAEYFRRLSKGR